MRKPHIGGRQHWVMLVDEASKYKKSFFLEKNNEQDEPIIDWIKALKARHKNQVKIIRCDNAGENIVLERESDKNEFGIIFEYTASGTPRQNGVMERAFATVMGRVRAMMNHAGFTMSKRQQLWCEAAQPATPLDNILVQDSAKSPIFSQLFGVDEKYAKHLKGFGEMCVVADTDNKVGRTKIDARGKICLFVGYSTQHAGDVIQIIMWAKTEELADGCWKQPSPFSKVHIRNTTKILQHMFLLFTFCYFYFWAFSQTELLSNYALLK